MSIAARAPSRIKRINKPRLLLYRWKLSVDYFFYFSFSSQWWAHPVIVIGNLDARALVSSVSLAVRTSTAGGGGMAERRRPEQDTARRGVDSGTDAVSTPEDEETRPRHHGCLPLPLCSSILQSHTLNTAHALLRFVVSI